MGAFERITIELPAETAEALRQSVTDGDYSSEGQIVAEALQEWFELQNSEDHQLERLRAAVRAGEESGPGIPAEQVYAELEALIATYKPHE